MTLCAEAVYLFEDGLIAREIVGGILESPYTTQAMEVLVVILP